MSTYSHASYLAQTRQGRRLLGAHEAIICAEVGHEYRPSDDGRMACSCCGAERLGQPLVDDEPCTTSGTFSGSGESS